MVRYGLILLFGVFVLSSCSTLKKNEYLDYKNKDLKTLADNIEYIISDPNLFNAHVGIYIESLDTEEILFKNNEHKLFIPASNMKLFTTFVGLNSLGPDFQYHTDILTKGKIENGVLEGDLIIKGSGDPTISGRFYDDNKYGVFDQWIDSLKSKGINEINGDLIGDESYFQNDPLGYGWQWDDEPFWYSAQMSALSFNDNCIDVKVTPGEKINKSPNIVLSPDNGYFTVINNAITCESDSNTTLFLTRDRNENVLVVKNSIPINKKSYNESITVNDPATFFTFSLYNYLRKNGITINGTYVTNKISDSINYDGSIVLFKHFSPPLKEIIEVINKRSHNFYVEQLLLTLSKTYKGTGSASDGTKYVKNYLSSFGITENEFLMYNGSGLSRSNMVTPKAVATLLRAAWKNRYFQYYYDSLPIAGVDGTLKNRMKKTKAEGNVRAKTGYVGHVRSLSGYVKTDSNENLIFSILVNNYTIPTPAINLLQDRICNVLSNFKR